MNSERLTKEEIVEVYRVCKYSSQKLTDSFNHAKAIWDIVNDTVSIDPIRNKKNVQPKQGLFFVDYNNKTLLYEFIIKPIKKDIKKIGEFKMEGIEETLKQVKNPLIKDLHDPKVHKDLIFFAVHHNNSYPLKETLLPIIKRKVMNYTIQSQVIGDKNLTKKK